MKAPAAVPFALSSPSRRIRALATTGVLGLFLVGTPLVVALAVVRVLSNRAITGEGGPDLGRADFLPLLVALTAVCTWLPGAVAAVGEVRGRDRPVRPSRFVPPSIRRVVAAYVEISLLGAGTLRGWTSTRVGASLADLQLPVRPEAECGDGAPGPEDHAGATVTPLATVRGPTSAPTRQRVATTFYEVQRGETWWGLADRFLGEGRRFAELKELNVGRRQADGTVLHPDTVLRSGWTIEVPANEATG